MCQQIFNYMNLCLLSTKGKENKDFTEVILEYLFVILDITFIYITTDESENIIGCNITETAIPPDTTTRNTFPINFVEVKEERLDETEINFGNEQCTDGKLLEGKKGTLE